MDEAPAQTRHRRQDAKKWPAEVACDPAIQPHAKSGDVSQEFANFVRDIRSSQEYDSAVTALLCREAYELGRKEGRMCSPKETLTTILVIAVTLLLLGAYLITHRL
jgi:hypothetical protein